MSGRRLLLVAGLLLASGALFAVGVVLLRPQAASESPVAPSASGPVDWGRWKTGSEEERNNVARQIVSSRALIGRSLAQATVLLGPEGPGNASNERSWYIGQRPSGGALMFPYEEYLVAVLDERNEIVDLRIINRD